MNGIRGIPAVTANFCFHRLCQSNFDGSLGAELKVDWKRAPLLAKLILVAETDVPTMLTRIGIMRALNRHVERVFNPDRKDHHWGKRKNAAETWFEENDPDAAAVGRSPIFLSTLCGIGWRTAIGQDN